ncbi:MAG: hypothetical protein IAF38_20170 [Bacteroidia bacterium]|nr:hypothetical protein [Bacteroidia bacterium]
MNLLSFYGTFLICCGIVSVIFIGMKAKTALVSGGMAGGLSLLTAYLIYKQINYAQIGGIVLSLGLFIVFSWRCTKTLFTLFKMIRENNPDVKGKGIAFLIIGLMAVVSIFVFALQVVWY